MRILRPRAGQDGAPSREQGAALMMAVLVLFVLVVVVFQISIATSTDARIARNQTTIANMDHAIESVLLQLYEDLASDGEAAAGAAAGGAAPLGAGGGGGGAAPPEGGGGGDQATDSSRDEWARPGRYEINDLTLRILHQDESSKYNVLAMLTADEDEARKAQERVVRILDLCREGTSEDIDAPRAEAMAEAMLEHMRLRDRSVLPRPELMTDDDDEPDRGLPLSLREFVVLDPFEPGHFRDFRDDDGNVVHSIESFLTVWTSLSTQEEVAAEAAAPAASGNAGQQPPATAAPGTGAGDGQLGLPGSGGDEGEEGDQGDPAEGGAGTPPTPQGATDPGSGGSGPKINVNRAPAAVLHGLMDDRDVPAYFWDNVLEFRNEEDEEAMDAQEEPVYDEFGREIVTRRIFTSAEDLAQVDGWDALEPIVQAELRDLLDVQSEVFSVFVTARRRTAEGEDPTLLWDADAVEEEEELGLDLMQTVRSVVWRRSSGSEVTIVPLMRWEELDYVPFEVQDFPDERR